VGRGLRQDDPQERLGTLRGQPSLETLIAQASCKILNSAKDLVPFAFAAGFARGLLATTSPRGTSRPPLGTTGLILKEEQAFAPLGST
jgi:hypothetical protein